MSASDRREAIVAAAVPLFAERGFLAVTTKEIARAAGISEALLYRHFDSKEAVFTAIQDHCVSRATEPVETLRRLPDDTNTLVLCVFALMWKIQSGPGPGEQDMCRLQYRSMLADGHFAAEFIARTSAPWVEKMRRCLVAAIDAGDITTTLDDAELGVWLGEHVSVAARLYALSGRQIVEYPGDSDRLIERSVAFCLRGLGLTPEAIATHYQPDKLKLLLEKNSPA